jgi:hypothetical protein
VPATSAGLPRVSFFFSSLFFAAAAIDSTNEAKKAPLSSRYSLDAYALKACRDKHLSLLLKFVNYEWKVL